MIEYRQQRKDVDKRQIADFVFLCCAAGHRKGSAGQEVKLNWVDRVPLDLYVLSLIHIFGKVVGR